MSNKEVIQMVKQGGRLECPESCPSVIYEELILPCWTDTAKRPSLQQIFRVLKDLEDTFSSGRRRATSPFVSHEYMTSIEIIKQ
jgi:hypothetical protein